MAGLIKSLNITDAILSGFTVYRKDTEVDNKRITLGMGNMAS